MSAARVNELVATLRSGRKLTDEQRRWLLRGQEEWQQGLPLESALGLREAPLRIAERKRLIRIGVYASPGWTMAEKFEYFRECAIWGRPHENTTAARMIAVLRGARCSIPVSRRQLNRILAENDRSALPAHRFDAGY